MAVKLSELLGRDLTRTARVPILLSEEAGEVIVAAQAERDAAAANLEHAEDLERPLMKKPQVAAAGEKLAAAEELLEQAKVAAEQHLVEFVVTTIPAGVWKHLELEHRPSDEDRELGFSYDPATFPVAAVAACIVEPEVGSVDEVNELYERVLPPTAWMQLWSAVARLNLGVTPVPFSLTGSRPTATSASE